LGSAVGDAHTPQDTESRTSKACNFGKEGTVFPCTKLRCSVAKQMEPACSVTSLRFRRAQATV
jgi:hypothetical protein